MLHDGGVRRYLVGRRYNRGFHRLELYALGRGVRFGGENAQVQWMSST